MPAGIGPSVPVTRAFIHFVLRSGVSRQTRILRIDEKINVRGIGGLIVSPNPVVISRVWGRHTSHIRHVVWRQPIAIVTGIQLPRQNQLLAIIQAIRALRFLPGLVESRQQKGCKDADDADDDEKFDEGETRTSRNRTPLTPTVWIRGIHRLKSWACS